MVTFFGNFSIILTSTLLIHQQEEEEEDALATFKFTCLYYKLQISLFLSIYYCILLSFICFEVPLHFFTSFSFSVLILNYNFNNMHLILFKRHVIQLKLIP
jgi:hypothetical protein